MNPPDELYSCSSSNYNEDEQTNLEIQITIFIFNAPSRQLWGLVSKRFKYTTKNYLCRTSWVLFSMELFLRGNLNVYVLPLFLRRILDLNSFSFSTTLDFFFFGLVYSRRENPASFHAFVINACSQWTLYVHNRFFWHNLLGHYILVIIGNLNSKSANLTWS